jgi:transcriptional regulator of acetoin/glycerol metabolism
VYDSWKAGEVKAVDAMKTLNLTKSTFYRKVREHERDIG